MIERIDCIDMNPNFISILTRISQGYSVLVISDCQLKKIRLQSINHCIILFVTIQSAKQTSTLHVRVSCNISFNVSVFCYFAILTFRLISNYMCRKTVYERPYTYLFCLI